uniref:Uncharacterized protein n=1 Tax=Aegilops tauschii subsp. strangulata TaxID=200361 RepID=A0A453JX80_AEGTS
DLAAVRPQARDGGRETATPASELRRRLPAIAPPPAARLPPTPRPPSSPDSRQSPPPASPLLRTAGAALASRPRRTPPPLYSLYSALSSTSRLPAQPAVRPSRGQGTRARRCRPHTVIRSSSSAAEALHYNTALRCRPH